MPLLFEWDEIKSLKNLKKHKVRFEEAKTVFSDPMSMTIEDKTHSLHEMRYIDLGYSKAGRLLVVVYTERNNKIRIISSRVATRNEKKEYEK